MRKTGRALPDTYIASSVEEGIRYNLGAQIPMHFSFSLEPLMRQKYLAGRGSEIMRWSDCARLYLGSPWIDPSTQPPPTHFVSSWGRR